MPDKTRAERNVAVLLLDADTMRIVWCNDAYAENMARRPPDELIGKPYEEVVAVMAPVKVPVFRRIAETGVSESGVDYALDLEQGSSARHWQIHRATPSLLVAIIDWD